MGGPTGSTPWGVVGEWGVEDPRGTDGGPHTRNCRSGRVRSPRRRGSHGGTEPGFTRAGGPVQGCLTSTTRPTERGAPRGSPSPRRFLGTRDDRSVALGLSSTVGTLRRSRRGVVTSGCCLTVWDPESGTRSPTGSGSKVGCPVGRTGVAPITLGGGRSGVTAVAGGCAGRRGREGTAATGRRVGWGRVSFRSRGRGSPGAGRRWVGEWGSSARRGRAGASGG